MTRELQIEKIRERMIGARVVAGLSQEGVANSIGISRATMNKYEDNPEYITLGVWLKLAELYGKKVSYFFGE